MNQNRDHDEIRRGLTEAVPFWKAAVGTLVAIAVVHVVSMPTGFRRTKPNASPGLAGFRSMRRDCWDRVASGHPPRAVEGGETTSGSDEFAG